MRQFSQNQVALSGIIVSDNIDRNVNVGNTLQKSSREKWLQRLRIIQDQQSVPSLQAGLSVCAMKLWRCCQTLSQVLD